MTFSGYKNQRKAMTREKRPGTKKRRTGEKN
jgi:hypothetical protein